MKRPKVFVIGFHKTGTTSLQRALEVLNYRVCGPVRIEAPDLQFTLSLVPQFDAFRDNPWPLLFRELDAAWPGSRFVLTLRDLDAWIASVVRHFGTRDTNMRRLIYRVGHPEGHESRYLARHRQHLDDVRAWFARRPDDLLEMDLARGDGWSQLCPFLGEPIPAEAFPHANQAGEREAQEARMTPPR